MSDVCAPDGAPVGELEGLRAALDAPGVTLSDVHRLLSRALGRPIRGSIREDWERLADEAQAERAWIERFCRTLAPTPREMQAREEIRRLSLEADLATAALTKLWDLSDRRRPAGLPSFTHRPTSCVVDHGACSVSGLRCEA